MEERLLRVEEVALTVGVSVKTINNWYAFKKEQPNNEYSKLLPDFVQYGERQTRYWKSNDIYDLIKFKAAIPKGRNGILGCITQKYGKKEKEICLES